MTRLLLGGWLAATFIASACATGAEPTADYVKVEIRGTLETGIVAIGGETTGTIIRAGKVVWELEFGKHSELKELAQKLNKQTVIVVGTYRNQPGVEVRERHIVSVASVKRAE